MFLFNACYFSQFVLAMSLFAQAFGTRAPVFILIGVEYCAVCAYVGWKGEVRNCEAKRRARYAVHYHYVILTRLATLVTAFWVVADESAINV